MAKDRRFVYHFLVAMPSGRKIKAFGWVDGTNKNTATKYIEWYCKREGYELVSIEEKGEKNELPIG